MKMIHLVLLILSTHLIIPHAFSFEITKKIRAEHLSLLLPLPKDESELNKMTSLKFLSSLTEENFNRLQLDPSRILKIKNNTELKESFRVVGIRLDPCKQRTSEEACEKQMRLIWQPILLGDSKNATTTFDVALHTFHPLTNSEWLSLLNSTQELDADEFSVHSPQSIINPLIHPHFQKNGLQDSRSISLLNKINVLLLKKDASEIAIQKMMNSFEFHWGFSHFKVSSDSIYEPLAIPVINLPLQSFENWGQEHSLLTDWAPFKPLVFGGMSFMQNSLFFKAEYQIDENTKKKFHIQRLNILNKTTALMNAKKTPFHGNTDCVSCHVAPAAKSTLLKDEKVSTKSLRFFGYNGSTPVTSERVFSEINENLKFLNSNK